MNPPRTFPWYLLTGLIIGLALGILIAWVIFPVQYVNTAPASLREDFQEQYRALIAAAYLATGDLARTQARLALLQDPNISDTLAAQAQRALAAGKPAEEVRALAQLASVAHLPPDQFPTPPPPTPSPTAANLPSPTPTANLTPAISPSPTASQPSPTSPTPTSPTPTLPLPTLTRTPTPALPFILNQQVLRCDPLISAPLLTVQILDTNGNGIPGIEIIMTWSGGEEHFFTGLKPELGAGYADFAMTPDLTYTLRLADGSQVITNLTATQCQTEDGQTAWGAWDLVFVQP